MASERADSGLRLRAHESLAAAFLVLAGAFAAGWWLIGDLSYSRPVEGSLDYTFKAPDLPGWLTAGAGLAGAAIAVAVVRFLWRRGTGGVAVTLAVVGVVAAWSARVITYGGIGANIGGALLLWLLLPLLALVAATAVVALLARPRGVTSRARPRGPRGG